MTVSERVICKSKRPVLCIVWPCQPLHWWCSTRERERCVAGGRSAHPHKGCPVCCMVVVSGIVWCICVSGLVRWYLFVYTHSFTGCTDTQTLSRHARRSSNEQHEHYRPHTPFILSARSPAHKHSLFPSALSRPLLPRCHISPDLSRLSLILSRSRCLAAAAISRATSTTNTRETINWLQIPHIILTHCNTERMSSVPTQKTHGMAPLVLFSHMWHAAALFSSTTKKDRVSSLLFVVFSF